MQQAELGTGVRDRLLAAPGAVKVPITDFDLFVLRDFLTAAECERLIRLIDGKRKPSRLMGDNQAEGFRTSETCNLDSRDRLVDEVEARLGALTGIERSHGEFLQGQRYAVGQQYRPHHDYLRTDAPYWPHQEKIGGQRTWTLMVFLNVPEKGGETRFPLAGVTIPPRLGSLVAWNNLDASGEPNAATLHQGMPVVAGVKYILTKWYRQRPWGVAA